MLWWIMLLFIREEIKIRDRWKAFHLSLLRTSIKMLYTNYWIGWRIKLLKTKVKQRIPKKALVRAAWIMFAFYLSDNNFNSTFFTFRQDCVDLLDTCLDYSKMGSTVSTLRVCSLLLRNDNQSGCVSVKDYLNPVIGGSSNHQGILLIFFPEHHEKTLPVMPSSWYDVTVNVLYKT